MTYEQVSGITQVAALLFFLALFVGGEVFGFMGILLAVPSAAVAKIFVTRAVKRYRSSALYLSPRAEAPSELDPAEVAVTMAQTPTVAPDRPVGE